MLAFNPSMQKQVDVCDLKPAWSKQLILGQSELPCLQKKKKFWLPVLDFLLYTCIKLLCVRFYSWAAISLFTLMYFARPFLLTLWQALERQCS